MTYLNSKIQEIWTMYQCNSKNATTQKTQSTNYITQKTFLYLRLTKRMLNLKISELRLITKEKNIASYQNMSKRGKI